ncbi:MAG: hypothetical protein ACR2MT_17645 [Aurantibacter sp.]
MGFKLKKTASILIVLTISAYALQGQKENPGTKDYGFQITELGIPKLAPSGYESILTVELNNPLHPKKEYEMGFWIIGKQLQDRGYSYPIAVFPSNFMGSVTRDVFKLVESFDLMPKLTVNPPPSYTGRGHFTFIIRPDTLYNHVTVALKNNNLGKSPINFREDVTVTGVFVRPFAAKTSDNNQAVPTQVDLPEKIAERQLIDSNENYFVSEKEIQIGLYDHRNIDSDVVTIYLNDEIIIESLQLKRKKQFFDVQLKPGNNTITLHAENLGEVAPNTAAILIKSKSKEFMAVLESDLGQSEYFTLICEPK